MNEGDVMGQYVEAHAFVYGHVQGVFFRDMTKRYAEEIGVVGPQESGGRVRKILSNWNEENGLKLY